MNKTQRVRITNHGFDLKRIFFDDPYSGIGPVVKKGVQA